MKNTILFLLSLIGASDPIAAGEVFQSENVQQFQQKFDDENFEINDGFRKLRHTLLHLMKTTGRIATYCEAKEHGKEPDTSLLINEALPDLLIYALQMANYYKVDLGEKYDERLKALEKKPKIKGD